MCFHLTPSLPTSPISPYILRFFLPTSCTLLLNPLSSFSTAFLDAGAGPSAGTCGVSPKSRSQRELTLTLPATISYLNSRFFPSWFDPQRNHHDCSGLTLYGRILGKGCGGGSYILQVNKNFLLLWYQEKLYPFINQLLSSRHLIS